MVPFVYLNGQKINNISPLPVMTHCVIPVQIVKIKSLQLTQTEDRILE
jgi:hypothetical protein